MGKRLFVIESETRKIVCEYYRPMTAFKNRIAGRLNLRIGDDYNLAWDFFVNG